LNYVACFHFIGAKISRFLSIIRARIGASFAEEFRVTCTKKAIYYTLAWLAYRILPDNKGDMANNEGRTWLLPN
jgi:hypothetical protein